MKRKGRELLQGRGWSDGDIERDKEGDREGGRKKARSLLAELYKKVICLSVHLLTHTIMEGQGLPHGNQ